MYGDLLFTGSGETKEDIGKCVAFVGDEEAYAGGDIVIVSPNLEENDPLFLGFLMNDRYIINQKSLRGQGDAVVHITGKTLATVQMVLPPLDEQRRIAKALSDIDGLISSLNKLIEKKQNIKTATMQQLLTGKKRLEVFTEPWVEMEVGEVVKIFKGQSLQSKNFITGKVPVVAGGQSYAGFHNVPNHINTTITISASGAYAGYVWLHEYPIFASDCSVIEGNDNVSIHFLYNVLKLKQEELYKAQTGGAQPHIHPKDVEPIKILLPYKNGKPYIDEQIAIANILTSMDKEIFALESKKAKYESIRKGMMQELLTGKIRLV